MSDNTFTAVSAEVAGLLGDPDSGNDVIEKMTAALGIDNAELAMLSVTVVQEVIQGQLLDPPVGMLNVLDVATVAYLRGALTAGMHQLRRSAKAEGTEVLTVTVTRSAGDDGAVLMMVDTTDSLGDDPAKTLRINVNDERVFGPRFEHDGSDNHRQAGSVSLEVTEEEVAYR